MIGSVVMVPTTFPCTDSIVISKNDLPCLASCCPIVCILNQNPSSTSFTSPLFWRSVRNTSAVMASAGFTLHCLDSYTKYLPCLASCCPIVCILNQNPSSTSFTSPLFWRSVRNTSAVIASAGFTLHCLESTIEVYQHGFVCGISYSTMQ